MSKSYFRTVWISDVHLCTRDCRVEDLFAFLKHIKCDTLYIVGDFLDLWSLRRRFYWPREFNDVIRRVLKMVRKGTQVYYIPGNHDELLRDYDGHEFGGVHIRTRMIHRTADGRRMLVLHGDEFDAIVQGRKWLARLGSAAYDYLIGLNRAVNWVRRRFGLRYYSLSGMIKRKVKGAVSYEDSFRAAIACHAARERVDGVICGHVHHAIIRMIEGVLYHNCGDWVESLTALTEDECGQISILHYDQDWLARHTGGYEPEDEELEPLPGAALMPRGSPDGSLQSASQPGRN